MNKSKFFTILIIGLIATNLMLIFFCIRRPEGPHPGHARHIVIERLHFDKAQVQKYDSLIHWHRSSIDKAQHDILELKEKLYGTLDQKANAEASEKIMDSIGQIKSRIEHIHYRHFQDIRK
ncbi:MAG: hypothetical protein EOO48_10640, partial [Flavobacterium sp.]